MARLNSRGEAVWGVGGGAGSMRVLLTTDGSGQMIDIGPDIAAGIAGQLRLSAVEFEGGSGWFWVDDDTLIGQFCGDPHSPSGCSIWTWHIPSKTLSGPIAQGANSGKGRGGSWALWLAGAAPGYRADEEWLGVYTNTSYRSRFGAVGDVFSNGNFLMIKDYHQQTLGMELIAKGSGAKIRDIATVGQVGGIFARGNVALWYDFGDKQLHAFNASAPVPAPGGSLGSGPFASDATGRLWICDGQNGVLVRAWDAHVGYWLSRDEFSFWQDCVALPNGKIRVVASQNQAESMGNARVWDLDPLTGAYTFNGQPGQAQLVDTHSLHGSPASLPSAPSAPIITASSGSPMGAPSEDDLVGLFVVGLVLLYLAWES